MMNTPTLVGNRYGKLLVVERVGVDHRKQSLYKCVCDCGNEKVIRSYSIKYGNTKSCGCLRREVGAKIGSIKKHGMVKTPTHNSWSTMKERCLNPKSKSYMYYGGSDVQVCEKWLTFEGFYEDMGERPKGTSLDRINPFGDYTKENCRWADKYTQSHNKRKNYIKELICRP